MSAVPAPKTMRRCFLTSGQKNFRSFHRLGMDLSDFFSFITSSSGNGTFQLALKSNFKNFPGYFVPGEAI